MVNGPRVVFLIVKAPPAELRGGLGSSSPAIRGPFERQILLDGCREVISF